MKKAIGITCAVVGSIAVVGGIVAVILNKRTNNCTRVVRLPKEIEDFALKHFKFGGKA